MGDGDRRSRPFEAGSRGTLGRRFQAEKGGPRAGGTGRYKGEKVKVPVFTLAFIVTLVIIIFMLLLIFFNLYKSIQSIFIL